MNFIHMLSDKAQRLLIKEIVALLANSSIENIIRLTYLAEKISRNELAPALDEYSRRYSEIADKVWEEEWKDTDIISERGEARGAGRLSGKRKGKVKGKKYVYAD